MTKVARATLVLLDTCGTPQINRQHRRCTCMAQTTLQGSGWCDRNAVCYRNNPLHKEWWKRQKKD